MDVSAMLGKHFPNDIIKRLNFDRWLRDFKAKIKLDQKPLLRDWWENSYTRACENLLPDEKSAVNVAYLGLLDTNFCTLDLPVPERWLEGRLYVRNIYTMSDINDFDALLARDQNERFNRPDKAYHEGNKNPWKLREQLANEFVTLYLAEIKKLAESVSPKSTTGKILERNSKLRNLTNEALHYNSIKIDDAFYVLLPDFVKVLNSKDPSIVFALELLQQKYVNEEAVPQFRFIIGQLNSYVDAISDGSIKIERKKDAEILKAEIEGCFNTIIRDHAKLRRQLDRWKN